MKTTNALSLIIFPALLLSGEAAARDGQSAPASSRCWDTGCKLATNGPELTGTRTAARATVVSVRLPSHRPPWDIGGSCPPFACGSDGNGPELTGTRTTARATVVSVRLPSHRPPWEIGGSCPPFMCGNDGNGPELTGLRIEPGSPITIAIRISRGATAKRADQGCEDWVCGSNGPLLTGMAKRGLNPFPPPPPPPVPLPVPYPNGARG